jgi:hypothetical protein
VLDEPITFTGSGVSLILANLTLVGAVYRSGNFSGTGSLRIVGGHGGWLKTIPGPGRFYQNPHGVKLGPVATDAANACGEKLAVDSDMTIGLFYTRSSVDPACRVLNQYAPSWYVTPDGVTHIGDRTTPTISSLFDVVNENVAPYLGRIPIATDFPADWVPGSKFSSPILGSTVFQISDVVHRLTPERLRTECWVLS